MLSVGERELDWVNNEQASPTKLDHHCGEGGLRLELLRAAPVGKELGREPACQGTHQHHLTVEHTTPLRTNAAVAASLRFIRTPFTSALAVLLYIDEHQLSRRWQQLNPL